MRGVVHLVDARRAPTDHDRRMVGYLAGLGLPALVVLTKMDKLKRTEREMPCRGPCGTLDVETEQLVPFSSRTGEGRDALLDALEALVVDGEPPRFPTCREERREARARVALPGARWPSSG